MSFTNTDIISIYNSRKTILDILNESHMKNNPLENINNYENFNINEVEAMAKNNQLDMLLTTEKDIHPSRKVYVKYHLAKTLMGKALLIAASPPARRSSWPQKKRESHPGT